MLSPRSEDGGEEFKPLAMNIEFSMGVGGPARLRKKKPQLNSPSRPHGACPHARVRLRRVTCVVTAAIAAALFDSFACV
jgi:hypothetical protein